MQIKEILTIDLSEDIKNVIDLEDLSEAEIQNEIESYIVTDGLAKEYADFVSIYTSSILETGVWISGFYGSGKSYFGKLLGYMLSNRTITGTPARDRILQRFTGIGDESLIKNAISRLNMVKSRVVFLDVAKQNTSKGLAYTLFRNFLKSLQLPENEHGFFLFHLMQDAGQADISALVAQHTTRPWSELKSRTVDYVKTCKAIFLANGHTESDYNNYLETIRRDIDEFSAARLKEEVGKYLGLVKDEKIVFLFDEASEAINQKKINLLDLEGISEALSALGGRVWTMAIAQEKLDDVINNSNVSKAQLTKVTDRFKTKIHLEATEVDVIIRNRLLKKTDDGVRQLKEYYAKNAGKIADHAALNGAGIAKTESEEIFETYYPFYKHQFDLLQNFLFGTKGYASTKVAARGMIITTYDILKREIQNNSLFEVAAGWQIAKEAQTSPPVRLVSRFENAERILKEASSPISGRKLLETLHFLTEAEVVPTTIPNIVKSFISHPDEYHRVLDQITRGLELLTDAKVVLDTNNTYRITSDIEQRLLDEMNGYQVQGFVKKKNLVTLYKASPFVKSLARITDSNLHYDFYITTDNDDELTAPALKNLKLRVKSIYNISDDRSQDVDTLKVQHQNDKDLIWLVPENGSFQEVDKLLDEIIRIGYLEEKYKDPKSEEGRIMQSFSTSKNEKENRVRDLVEESLQQGTAIHHYNVLQLNENNWQNLLQGWQRQVIQNVYSKRLASQLSDAVAASVIKEANNARLGQYFHGSDFLFFNTQGNFVGDNLKVVEEITYKIRNTFVDGATLEKELEQPPTGFTFGTVISTLAALMRAGKIIAKYNGAEKYSWRDDGVKEFFAAAREFRKAGFKAISKSLSATQKQQLAQFLLEVEVELYIGKKVNYNTNDFELVNAVRELAKHFVDKATILKNNEPEFARLFPGVEDQKDLLGKFTGAVSEANYVEKAEDFLAEKDTCLKALQGIEKVEKFIKINLPKVKDWRQFVRGVGDELTKAARTNATLTDLSREFDQLLGNELVKNFASLQHTAQKIRDEYYALFSEAMQKCSARYVPLQQEAEALLTEIDGLPAGLNIDNRKKAESIRQFAEQRTSATVQLDFDVKDKHSRFSYSEVLSFLDLAASRKAELGIIQASLVRTAPTPPPVTPPTPGVPTPGGPPPPPATPTPRRIAARLPAGSMKVPQYRQWLQQELMKIAAADANDEIQFE